MTNPIAIELNDVGLWAAGQADARLGPSPGYALLNGKELWVGRQAQANARLKPRWVDHRFWDQLGMDTMPRPFPRHLSRADVAHAHLSELWSEIQKEMGGEAATASVLLAVPGSLTVQQLGLTLGIARSIGMPVSGMVDAALAAVAPSGTGPRVLHLDVLLHRWVWTELRHEGELARKRVEVIDTGGLVNLWDLWARRIAELLVRQTRFDPFHHGRAEQALYDNLPEWLATLARDGSVLVSLESDGKQRAVELDDTEIGPVSGEVMAPVVELARLLVGSGERPVLALSARAAAVPGLRSELSRLAGAGVLALGIDAAVEGTMANRESIESPGSDLPFVVRLPAELQPSSAVGTVASPPSSSPSRAREPVPTHVLFENRAYAIGEAPLWVGSAIDSGERGIEVGRPMPGLSRMHCCLYLEDRGVWIDDRSSYGTYLNDSRVLDKQECSVGDRLRLGSPGVELLLIAVEGDDV